ncbi:hypothetical protein LX36DRAFT_270634 [Colletotrichum falcatum]|nr:hypothetical protein LX36DRAFT_270634 [Colletotrichum falcatum]
MTFIPRLPPFFLFHHSSSSPPLDQDCIACLFASSLEHASFSFCFVQTARVSHTHTTDQLPVDRLSLRVSIGSPCLTSTGSNSIERHWHETIRDDDDDDDDKARDTKPSPLARTHTHTRARPHQSSPVPHRANSHRRICSLYGSATSSDIRQPRIVPRTGIAGSPAALKDPRATLPIPPTASRRAGFISISSKGTLSIPRGWLFHLDTHPGICT